MFRIGEFSKINKITVKTLRYYDEIGLFRPSFIDEKTGYRFYSGDQIPLLNHIVFLKQIGFSLEEIADITGRNVTDSQMTEYLQKKLTEVQDLIQNEQQRLTRIHNYLKLLKEETRLKAIVIKELPEVIVASMRTVIESYGEYNRIYPEMGEYMRKAGCACREPEYCFSLYHDGEYKERNIDVEICQAVTEFKPDSEKIKFKKIPAVKTAACVQHKGPYHTLGKSYSALFSWIEENGYEAKDLPREMYIDGCWNKENESDYLTEIQVPIKKH